MGETSDFKAAAKTWQTMVDSNQALLLRKSGHDVHWWAEEGRAKGLKNDAGLRDWMRDEHGITGYAQYAVSWEMFGYPPEFMLRDADELIDGQYANHPPQLRPPIADALMAWSAETDGVVIQMRKAMFRFTALGGSLPRSPGPTTPPLISPCVWTLQPRAGSRP